MFFLFIFYMVFINSVFFWSILTNLQFIIAYCQLKTDILRYWVIHMPTKKFSFMCLELILFLIVYFQKIGSEYLIQFINFNEC